MKMVRDEPAGLLLKLILLIAFDVVVFFADVDDCLLPILVDVRDKLMGELLLEDDDDDDEEDEIELEGESARPSRPLAFAAAELAAAMAAVFSRKMAILCVNWACSSKLFALPKDSGQLLHFK